MSEITTVQSPELRLMKGALAKTTDENLTSENWEFILVRVAPSRHLHPLREARGFDRLHEKIVELT